MSRTGSPRRVPNPPARMQTGNGPLSSPQALTASSESGQPTRDSRMYFGRWRTSS